MVTDHYNVLNYSLQIKLLRNDIDMHGLYLGMWYTEKRRPLEHRENPPANTFSDMTRLCYQEIDKCICITHISPIVPNQIKQSVPNSFYIRKSLCGVITCTILYIIRNPVRRTRCLIVSSKFCLFSDFLFFLALLDYIIRANETEICPSSFRRRCYNYEPNALISLKFWLLLPLGHTQKHLFYLKKKWGMFTNIFRFR